MAYLEWCIDCILLTRSQYVTVSHAPREELLLNEIVGVREMSSC